MNQSGRLRKRALGWGISLLWLACCLPGSAADSLDWRQGENRVAAEIDGWDLPKLLANVAAATGWQVFVEPDTHLTISTKFKDRPPGEALRLLLGNLSYFLLQQADAAPKLVVFRTSPQEATQLVPAAKKRGPPKSAKPIANELIVTLKPGAKIDELAKKLGAKIIGRVDGLNTFRLQFEDADAANAARESLKTNSDVESIDSNFPVVNPPPVEALTYSSPMPALDLKVKTGGEGGHPVVGLVDTPIQQPGGSLNEFLLPSLSAAGDAKTSDTWPTHATGMSETILRGLSIGLAGSDTTAVKILPVDVYGNNADTTTFEVAQGIYKAIGDGATIINLSLGSDGDSGFLHQVIQSGHEQGIVFVAAAGNEPVTTPTYPAAYPEVLAVTAGDRKGNLADYANRGDFVDVIAPGSAIVSFNGQSYVISGTSTSTAYVTGLIAAEFDQTKKTPAQVEADIRSKLALKR